MRRTLALGFALALLVLARVSAAGPCGENEHHLRFVNFCDEAIWLAEVGNSSGYCTADSQCQQTPAGIQFCNIPGCSSDSDCPALSCTTNDDCPPGGTCLGNNQCTGVCDTSNDTCYCSAGTGCPGGGQCNTMGSGFPTCEGGLCTFSTIRPKGRGAKRWRLAPPHRKWRHAVSMCVPETWQGRFWARTGCDFHDGELTCVTGQCDEGAVNCTGQSASGVTLFEPTFDAPAGMGKTVDYYDVSLVSGYNVPLEVKPGKQGCVTTGGCKSDLNASCPAALQLTDGPCSIDSDCKTGSCISGTCVVGCSDPCTICTDDPSNAALDCANNADEYCCHGAQQTNTCNSGSTVCANDDDCKNLGNGTVNGTCNANHLCEAPCTTDGDCPGSSCNMAIGQCASVVVGCSGMQSCPAQTPPQPTASCESGIFAGGDVCVPQTNCCGPYNPGWLTAAATTGGWPNAFKAACPTAYSYQYDDPSSTFTCAPDGGPLRYKITFCPR